VNIERRVREVEELDRDRREPVFLAQVADSPGLFGEIETQKGFCTRFSARLFVAATSSPFCSKTRSIGEPRTVPSLCPLRREGQELNKDFG
jgi:hypothetical protein